MTESCSCLWTECSVLYLFSSSLSEIFGGDSQTVYSALKLLSSDRANIYCFRAASMLLWLGYLFLKLVSFGFGLASESWLYYWPVYPYGADKNVWVGYKFQVLRNSLAALFYVLFMVVHFPAHQESGKLSVQRMGNIRCLGEKGEICFHLLYIYTSGFPLYMTRLQF